ARSDGGGCPARVRAPFGTKHGLLGRAGRHDPASSVAPVASGYARSLRPWLALAQRTRSARGHSEMSSRTRIAHAYPDRVEVRGRDLAGELMGRVTFTEYFHLLLTGDEPTDEQRFFLDLLLVAIAEHGLMPSNVAARMTLAADPGSLHGAVAAGILGAGPVV